MKKLFTLTLLARCFGLAQAQMPADGATFTAQEVSDDAHSYVLTFAQLNDDVMSVMTELKTEIDGRQLFTEVKSNPANNSVTVKVANDKMNTLSLREKLCCKSTCSITKAFGASKSFRMHCSSRSSLFLK